MITFTGVTGDLHPWKTRSRAGGSCCVSLFRTPGRCALVEMNGIRDGTHAFGLLLFSFLIFPWVRTEARDDTKQALCC